MHNKGDVTMNLHLAAFGNTSSYCFPMHRGVGWLRNFAKNSAIFH
jgi:hypothetical protein